MSDKDDAHKRRAPGKQVEGMSFDLSEMQNRQQANTKYPLNL
jgi:hypothetical protein